MTPNPHHGIAWCDKCLWSGYGASPSDVALAHAYEHHTGEGYGPTRWSMLHADAPMWARPSNGRTFDSGAMRDSEDGKYDFEGFLSPQVLTEFAAYMHKNRFLKDGRVRDSDNWQGGMPRDVYMKSILRHLMDLWLLHRGHPAIRPETGEAVSLPDTLGGLLFNLQGYWLQVIRESK